jgi:hypothetical protein
VSLGAPPYVSEHEQADRPNMTPVARVPRVKEVEGGREGEHGEPESGVFQCEVHFGKMMIIPCKGRARKSREAATISIQFFSHRRSFRIFLCKQAVGIESNNSGGGGALTRLRYFPVGKYFSIAIVIFTRNKFK